MKDKGYSLFIGISHPTILPDEITAVLRLEPEHSHRAGEVRVSPQGEPGDSTYRENYWGRVMFEGEVSKSPLSVALIDVIDGLYIHKEFFQKVRAYGGCIDLRIFYLLDESMGDFFSADLIRKIADLCMDISLTIYP